MTTFADLLLIDPLLRAVEEMGYDHPTPIQSRAIPPLLLGNDVLGCAQTGTGKTAAFSLPILQHLAGASPQKGRRRIRALVLTPTRELAAQIEESFGAYGRHLPFKHLVIFGGVNEKPQIRTLQSGIDILVATPGRLLDLEGRGFINLADVEFFVLDEADRMLDMGFIHDIRRVMKRLPRERQNLLFSATMPKKIKELADTFLRNPRVVEVAPPATTVERIEQQVMFVERPNKRRLLVDLLSEEGAERVLVFTRTKHGANRLVKQLGRAGLEAAPIHGNKSQSARERALAGFKDGSTPILVATDIASRGLDVEEVSHVVNFDLPNEPETYVHRIGRTGRAGRSGVAISFCDQSEGEYLRAIERTTGLSIPVCEDHDWHFPEAIPPLPKPRSRGRGKGRNNKNSRSEGARSNRSGARGLREAADQALNKGRGSGERSSDPGRREERSEKGKARDTEAMSPRRRRRGPRRKPRVSTPPN